MGVLIVVLAVLFIAGGLMAFRNIGKAGLPDKLPPPLPDDPEEE